MDSTEENRSYRPAKIAARVVFLIAVLVLASRPRVLYPVGGRQCGFCFREATSEVTYRNTGSGTVYSVPTCDSHRRFAPETASAGTLGMFKTVLWIVMIASSGSALFILGRMLFLEPPGPQAEFGFGCIAIAMVPLLMAELLHFAGWLISGRIVGWLGVMLMFSAAMAVAIPIPASTSTENKAG